MSKERTSVSLDPEVAEYLSQNGTNASELVNELVKQHMNGGASEEQILDFRISQVESETESLKAQLERKEQELSELLGRKETLSEQEQKQEQETIQEAYEKARIKELNSGIYIDTSDETLQYYADELEISLHELKQKLTQRYNGKND